MFDSNDTIYIIGFAIFIMLGIVFFYRFFLKPWIKIEREIKRLDKIEFEKATRRKFATLFDEKNYVISHGKNFVKCFLKHVPSLTYIEYRISIDLYDGEYYYFNFPDSIYDITTREERQVISQFLEPIAIKWLERREQNSLDWAKKTFITEENK